MALTKVTGQVINTSTDVTVGVLTVTSTLAVGGTVSIGGTLTYEDVTNIDSVGLITARNGIVVGSGITLSKDGDIFATGVTTTSSLVSSGAISGTTGTFSSDVSAATLTSTGNVTLPDSIIHTGDTDTKIRFPSADTVTVETGGTKRFEITSDGKYYFTGTGGGSGSRGFEIDTESVGAADEGVILNARASGTTGRIKLQTNSATAMTILGNGGNIGIGNLSPQQLLHVWPDTANTTSAYVRVTSGDRGSGTGIDLGSDADGDGRLNVVSNGNLKLYTNDTERLRIDSSGRVLIGTDTAGDSTADDLTIANSTVCGITIRSGTSSEGNIFFADGTSGDSRYRGMLRYDHNVDAMVLKAAGSERLRIDSGGRIYTGGDTQTLDATAGSLHISGGTSGGRLAFRGTTTSATSGIAEIFAFWDTNKVAGVIAKSGTDTSNKDDGTLHFYTAPDGTLVERAQIASNGNVGIAEDEPQNTLHVTGQTRISQSSTHSHALNAGTGLEIRGDAIGDGVVDNDFFKGLKIALNDGVEWGGQAQFAVGRWQDSGNKARSSLMVSLAHNQLNSSTNADTDIFMCRSDGYFLVTGQGSWGAGYQTEGASLRSNGDSTFVQDGAATVTFNRKSNAGKVIDFYNGTTYAGGIYVDGASSTAIQQGSDYRLKDNVTSMSDGITKIKQLNPIYYTNKQIGDVNDTTTIQTGFLAHEVQTVIPTLVDGEKDAPIDEKGKGYQTLNYAGFTPTAIAAIKELIAKVEILETKVAALESS